MITKVARLTCRPVILIFLYLPFSVLANLVLAY